MMPEESDVLRAARRAYLLGVATTAVVLWLWLLAATIILWRGYKRGRGATSLNLLAGLYVFLGYVVYLALLDPITIWFMNRVAVVESLILHAAWVRVGVPSVSVAAWLAIMHF